MGKKIKIAINATFTLENPSGLGIYTDELVQELLKLECDFDFTVYSSSKDLKNLYPNSVIFVTPYTSPSLGLKGHLMRLLWQQTILPFRLRKQKAGLLFSTAPEGIWKSSQKQILTILDIIPVKFPEILPRMKYYYYYILPILLKNSHLVICISENTKKDIISYYKVKEKFIHVIYPGFNKEKFYPRNERVGENQWGKGKYLLFIGDMRPYKNLERVLEAFARLDLRDINFLIGGNKDPRFYPRIEKKVDELFLKDRVLFLDYVSQKNLPHLYSEAGAFVFPSLYEGFGLPPLEAMACGCPVIVSNVASLPEVCGDAGYYVDPYRVESIAEGIYQVLTDESLRQSLIEKGLIRAKLFSWEKSAEEHLKVFEEVLGL
jgi:glycosyltransferase involved in cell wall biosynthesis